MLDETTVMRALRRHWEYEGKDYDISHEIYHDDAVLEFPQSGERFEGVENFLTWRKQYPAALEGAPLGGRRPPQIRHRHLRNSAGIEPRRSVR
jgi:hypothetical protein